MKRRTTARGPSRGQLTSTDALPKVEYAAVARLNKKISPHVALNGSYRKFIGFNTSVSFWTNVCDLLLFLCPIETTLTIFGSGSAGYTKDVTLTSHLGPLGAIKKHQK